MEYSEIISAKICPYCGNEPELVDSSVIYGTSYGNIYLCSQCDAYVGVHKYDGITPLGRLADRQLREWKKAAHSHFDPIWKSAIKEGVDKSKARTEAYKWLSEVMKVNPEFAHIGMFDVEQCKELINHCISRKRGSQ